MRHGSAEIFCFQSFVAGGHGERFRHGQGRPALFDVVRAAFPLLTTASPTHRGALKNGRREAVVLPDIPEQFGFLSLATRGGSCGLSRKLILPRTQSLVLAPSMRYGEVLYGSWCQKSGEYCNTCFSNIPSPSPIP